MPYADVTAALEQSVVTWEHLDWIRQAWNGPVVIKGIHTADDARRTKAPPAIVKRADDALAAIAKTQGLATASRVAVLNLQVKIGEQLALAEAGAAQVAQAMSMDMSTLLRPDAPPVWRVWREGPSPGDMAARVRESAAPQLDILARFFTDRAKSTAAHGGLFVVQPPYLLFSSPDVPLATEHFVGRGCAVRELPWAAEGAGFMARSPEGHTVCVVDAAPLQDET